MPVVERSALVLYSAEKMYSLVEDVDHYPEFLSWCVDAEVLSQDASSQDATLTVALAGIRKKFQTRNILLAGKSISLELVEGPFTRLSGRWEFTHLSTEGCRISLRLEFEFSHSLLSVAFERGFARVVDRLVNDFVDRAEGLYA
ncbi:MAG: type II toxin-antitoxin system RatA family toxin [Xanthomonadales bacterium]|nr:type II toxin-antitoxin system RatA family toxin [Xanthomonadales bacterium]